MAPKKTCEPSAQPAGRVGVVIMKDESWAAEFAAQIELACQDLVVGMALGNGGEDGAGFRTEFF
jgi:hypothetical protein